MSIVVLANNTAAGIASSMSEKLERVLSVTIPKSDKINELKRLCASKADLIDYDDDDKDWSKVHLYLCIPYTGSKSAYSFREVVEINGVSDVQAGDYVLACVDEELQFYQKPCKGVKISVDPKQSAEALLLPKESGDSKEPEDSEDAKEPREPEEKEPLPETPPCKPAKPAKKAPKYPLTKKFRSQFPSPVGRVHMAGSVFRATSRFLVEVGKLASYGMFDGDDSMLQAMVQEYVDLPDPGVLEPVLCKRGTKKEKQKEKETELKIEPKIEPKPNRRKTRWFDQLQRKKRRPRPRPGGLVGCLPTESADEEGDYSDYDDSDESDDEFSAFTRFVGFIHRTRHLDYGQYRRRKLQQAKTEDSKDEDDEDSKEDEAQKMRLVGWAREEMEWFRRSFNLGEEGFDWEDGDRSPLFHETPMIYFHAALSGYETWLSHVQELYARIVNFQEDPLGNGKPDDLLRIPLQAPHPWIRFANMVHMSMPRSFLADVKVLFHSLPCNLLGDSSCEKDPVQYSGGEFPQSNFVLFIEDGVDALKPISHQLEQLEEEDKSVRKQNDLNEAERYNVRTAGFKLYSRLCTAVGFESAGANIDKHDSLKKRKPKAKKMPERMPKRIVGIRRNPPIRRVTGALPSAFGGLTRDGLILDVRDPFELSEDLNEKKDGGGGNSNDRLAGLEEELLRSSAYGADSFKPLSMS